MHSLFHFAAVILQKAPRNEVTERSLLLALYTEVTIPNASRDTTHVAPPEASY